jgi:PmbA protein
LTSAEVEKGSVKKGENLLDVGASARVVVGRSVGFAYATSFDEKDILEVIEEATVLAKAMPPDPDFQSMPGVEPYPSISKRPDKRIDSITVEEAIDMAQQIGDSARIDPRIYSINTSVDLASVNAAIVNTLGISMSEKDTYVGVSANIVTKSESEMASGFEFRGARKISEIDLGWVGREAATQSVKSLGAKKISSGRMPVVFGQKVTAAIISAGVSAASSAENIQRKRSYLTGKLGESIANSEVTVTDDGTLPNGLLTSKSDAEGSPRTKTTIVEKGVLKAYLQDSYTAKKDRIKNTGNAVRSGGWDYRTAPGIGHTNLILKPGRGKIDDLISEVREGILVLYTGDRPNIATGEFSAQATVGFKIENGDIAFPTKQAMIGVKLIDLLDDLDAIGNDSQQISGVIAPSIRAKEAAISGGT